MKIAIVAPTAIPSRRANSIQSMKMAQAIANLGHEVRIAAPLTRSGDASEKPSGGSQPATDWQSLAHHYGLIPDTQSQITAFTIDWLPAHNRLRRYDFSFRSVRWARKWQADLLYTRLPQAAALASQIGLPTILESHDLPQGRTGPWYFRLFLKGNGALRLVAITHALADDLHQLFGAPALLPSDTVSQITNPLSSVPGRHLGTIVAPDGVDLSRYTNLPDPKEARRQLSLSFRDAQHTKGAGQFIIHNSLFPIERFTAGYTGHLYAGRGLETILALASRLPEINFLLVGGEPGEVEQLSAMVASLNLANVFITGFIPNAELPLYQAACEVLLMPYQKRVAASSGGDISRYLSPMKVFEYMASGRAILSSALPVLSEVLTPQNATLLPPDDLDAWANALQNLHRDAEQRQRMAEQARIDAQQYSWEARAQRILNGYPDRS